MDAARRALGALLRASDAGRQFPVKSEYFAERPGDAEVLEQLLADHRFVAEVVPRARHSPRLAITLPGVFALDPVKWAVEQAAIIELCDVLRDFSRTNAHQRVDTGRFIAAGDWCRAPAERRVTQIVSARLSGQYQDDPSGYQGWGASVGGADHYTGYFLWINLSPLFLRSYRPTRTAGPLLATPLQFERPMPRLEPLGFSAHLGPQAILALARVPDGHVHVLDLQAVATGLMSLPVPAVDLSQWPDHNRLAGVHRRRLDPLARRLGVLRTLGVKAVAPPGWATNPTRQAAGLSADLEGLVAADHIPGDYPLIKNGRRVMERAIKQLTARPDWSWLTAHVELGEWCRWVP